MTFEGFEWFIYNRTAAFDNIVSHMEAKTPVPERRTQGASGDGAASQLRHFFSKSSAGGDSAYGLSLVVLMPQIDYASRLVGNVPTSRVRNPFSAPKFLRNFAHWLLGQLPDLNVKDLLPLSFEGLNGGIVCGNMSTPNILVAEFSRADGSFGTVMVRRFPVIRFLNSSTDLLGGFSPSQAWTCTSNS